MTRGNLKNSPVIDAETGLLGRPIEAGWLPVPADVQEVRLEAFPSFMHHEDHHFDGRARMANGLVTPEPFLKWTNAPTDPLRPEPASTRDFADTARPRLVEPEAGMLDRFYGLAGEDVPAARVVAFARRYGILGICRHGLPCTHTPFSPERPMSYRPVRPSREVSAPFFGELCTPLGWDGHGGLEPVAAWCRYAQLARAILHVADHLRRGRTPALEALWVLRDHSPARLAGAVYTAAQLRRRRARAEIVYLVEEPPPARLQAIAWPAVVFAVNRWLVHGDVRPWMTYRLRNTAIQPRLYQTSPWWLDTPSWPLFGYLGLQLAAAVCSATHAPCEACGGPRKAGQRRFCDKIECQRVAAKLRQQRHRSATKQRRMKR